MSQSPLKRQYLRDIHYPVDLIADNKNKKIKVNDDVDDTDDPIEEYEVILDLGEPRHNNNENDDVVMVNDEESSKFNNKPDSPIITFSSPVRGNISSISSSKSMENEIARISSRKMKSQSRTPSPDRKSLSRRRSISPPLSSRRESKRSISPNRDDDERSTSKRRNRNSSPPRAESPAILDTPVRKLQSNRSVSPGEDEIVEIDRSCKNTRSYKIGGHQLYDLLTCVGDYEIINNLIGRIGDVDDFEMKEKCPFHSGFDNTEWQKALTFPSNYRIVENTYYTKENLTRFISYLLAQRFSFVEQFRDKLKSKDKKIEDLEIHLDRIVIERDYAKRLLVDALRGNPYNRQ